jgi:hypothetical protein
MKIIATVGAILQIFVGLLILSGLRKSPPPFIWGKWFFLPAFYVVIVSLGCFLIFSEIKTIRKKYSRNLRAGA